MRKKKTIREKLIAVIVMAAVVITMIPAGLVLFTDGAHAATTYSYTSKRPTTKVNGKKVHVTSFTVSGLGLKGTCCQPDVTARKGKTNVKKLSNTDVRTKLMYYYGYQKGYLGKTNKNGFLLCRALSWSSGIKKTSPVTKAEIQNYIKAMPSSLVVPNRFECYFCDPVKRGQNFIAYRMNPPAYVTLNKTSTNKTSLAAGSGYSFAGIEYTVYKGGTAVGKLTCKANGTTNKLTLDTGTYTVKETKTNKWYKLNTQTFTKTLSSGQTWTIAASDSPQMGTIRIKKKVTGSYSGSLAFTFRLTNTANSAIAYTVKTNGETGEGSAQVIQGTYRCEEILSGDSELVDVTGVQTAAVSTGGTYTFERENKTVSEGTLMVSKRTDDGGSAEGFRFKITGKLYNQGEITAERILEEADPSITGFDKDIYEPGDWEVQDSDVKDLNKAAENRETGSKTVTLKNNLKYRGEKGTSISDIVKTLESEMTEGTIKKGTLVSEKGKVYKAKEDVAFAIVFEEEELESELEGDPGIDEEKTADRIRELLAGKAFEEVDVSDIDVSFDARINLLPVDYVYDEDDPQSSGYETDLDRQIKNKEQKKETKNQYEVEYSSFDWHGSATLYQEVKNGELTGKTEVTVETGKDGTAPELDEGITSGAFTVSEIMTDSQKKRYREPQAQTKEIREKDGSAAFVFSFENKARWTDVGLVKTSDDGKIAGITFRLEGTDCRGEKIDLEAVTDEKGTIDFGKLYAGEYVISEKDFDPLDYENSYQLEGYDTPAQKLVITGDETEDITVHFNNSPLKSLYLTKVDKASQLFLKNGVFALFEGDKQLALFRIVMDDFGQAGIEMLSCDESSGIHVASPQVSVFQDEDGSGDNQNAAGSADQSGASGDDGDITIVGPNDNSDTENNGAENNDAENGAAESGHSENGANDDVESGEQETGGSTQTSYNFAVIKGLKEGKTYTIKEVTAPAGYAASIDYSFTFEGGQKLVLENAAPEIATSAVDKATKNHMSNAEGKVTIIDTVSYSNLGPGHKYLMSGVLAYKHEAARTVEEIDRDAEEVEVVKDAKGKEITAQKEFVPKTENGTVDMEFTFDASLLDGRQVVALEQLADPALTGVNGVITVVASHEDVEDEAQSIYFPKVETTASADDTGKRITEADGEITITDVVDYSNVIKGKIYELTGTLMDQETGKPLLSKGNKVTSSVRFKAEKDGPVFAADGAELKEDEEGELELVSGRVEMKFTFDGSALSGKGAVVFEKLTTNGRLVGEHSDINDDAQTVLLPSITTTASTNGKDVVADKVIYKNLLPGETYVMKGVLMDKATGKELLLNGQTVTAEKEFKPEKRNGDMTMEFPVSVKDLKGKTAVVFETCSIVTQSEEGPLETEVISHKDINNKAQTVTFNVPKTGQEAPWKMMGLLGIMTAASILALFEGIRRMRRIW